MMGAGDDPMLRRIVLGFGVAMVVLIGLFAVGWVKLVHVNDRVTSDEQRTCSIQARGLPAGHELAASMRDIHSLLTIPPAPDAPPTPPRVTWIVKALDGHLAAFLRDEAKQPHGRAC